MLAKFGFQTLPQILVFHRLSGGSFPAISFPTADPLGDALTYILRVRGEHYIAGAGQTRERLDGRHEFHTVVGGLTFSALNNFFGGA